MIGRLMQFVIGQQPQAELSSGPCAAASNMLRRSLHELSWLRLMPLTIEDETEEAFPCNKCRRSQGGF